MFEEVKYGDRVLLIWSGTAPPKEIEAIVHQLNSSVGSTGKVAVEHEERLKLCKYCERLQLQIFPDWKLNLDKCLPYLNLAYR